MNTPTHSDLCRMLEPADSETLNHKTVRQYFKIGIADYCRLTWTQIQTLVQGYCHAHGIPYNA